MRNVKLCEVSAQTPKTRKAPGKESDRPGLSFLVSEKSSRLFRKKNPEEGQVKSNSIINILCTVTPRKEMSPKDLQAIENIKWDPPFAYDPSAGWKKSSVNVKNYGRMVHSSKVQFRFLHCQDIHDCFLDLFQTHLHFVSNTSTGLTYQGTLPLSDITVCKLQTANGGSDSAETFSFQIDGVGLNPIIVYCSNQEELDTWFGHLKEQVEANGGTVITPKSRTYASVKNPEEAVKGKEELRNSVGKEPIYEWEGSQRESLGVITYVTKVRVQHLPCQDQHDRLLVMYPSTLIILSEESNGLFYKGKLPLNSISVTTPCQSAKPNTFTIEGKLINPIVVTCLDESEYQEWICHLRAVQVPAQIPPPPVYDIIYTPTKTTAPEFDRWSGHSHREQRHSRHGRGSNGLTVQNHGDDLMSPGYTTPLCFASSRPGSGDVGLSARLSDRSNSISSQVRPIVEVHPPHRGSNCSGGEPLSPVYNTPYHLLERSAPHLQQEKAPLVKSNSWSTPQAVIKHQLSNPQRNSDTCAFRMPLSPLYDDPWTPGMHVSEDSYVNPAMPRPHRGRQEDPPAAHLQPQAFKLLMPPLGRRKTQASVPRQEVESSHRAAGLKLLSPPTAALPHADIEQALTRPRGVEMSAGYSQEEISYLEPAEPDDQEVDYDNIWDFDPDTGMSQPLARISPYRTLEG
uniref:Pleckstrin homology domain containing, family N member 1 n=1 Tax=Scleropages formosus TaxID=113540 RepID=A0A8C9RHS4_SCLFO